MYSSHYNKKSPNFLNIRKSTSQYIFLNTVRAFSIIYLVLTIFHIPIYVGLSEVNSLYWQEKQTNHTYLERIFLEETIFAITKYESCYQQQQVKIIKVKGQTSQQGFYLNGDGKYCVVNKLSFIPFIKTVEDFHTLYFTYFLVIYLALFSAVILADHMNKKLYIELQYSTQRRNWKQKLQTKKILHVLCEVNHHIYFTKPLLKQALQGIFQQQNQDITVGNINICLNENFRRYAQLHIECNLAKQRISSMREELMKIKEKQTEFEELKEQILKVKEKQEKVQFQMSHLIGKMQKTLDRKQNYHYGHFFVHLNSFSDTLKLTQLIQSSHKHFTITTPNNALSFTISLTQAQNLLIQNIQNRQLINFLSSMDKGHNTQFWTEFTPNKHYKNLNKFLQYVKVLSGCVICVMLMAIIDVAILIVKRTEIFSYPTILVVLILEIILKILIIYLSQLQRHDTFSVLNLTIMLKLTIFIFFNIVGVLLLGLYDLGTWEMANILSTNQLSLVNEEWYLKIGTPIILTLFTQIIFCNLRVYIQIIKTILLKLIQKRLFSLVKLKRLKQRLSIWVEDIKQNYHKPIIDLQLCYAQTLPIYMIGIVFGYFFPILYPLLCMFSISIHYTHQNYIQYETEKFLYNGMDLNDWAFMVIYVSFAGGLGVMLYVEWENNIFVFIILGLQCAIFIAKLILSNLSKMNIQKLHQMAQQQTPRATTKNVVPQIECQNDKHLESQRKMVREKPWREIKQIKSEFIKKQQKQKEIELTLLRLFGSQGQNINDVHACYYQKYEQIIRGEIDFLKGLQREFHQTQ